MFSNDAGVRAQAVSLTEPSPVRNAEDEQVSSQLFLDSLVALSKMNGLSVVEHGARLAIVGELLVSVLTHLPYGLRADIVASFRDRIEASLSHWDDRTVPESYRSAFLSEVNRYLNVAR
jgi:hypothetical protein